MGDVKINALNGVNFSAPETKKHIIELAKKLNYIPDLRGKNLKAKKIMTPNGNPKRKSQSYWMNSAHSAMKLWIV